jgi:hypothetical protein
LHDQRLEAGLRAGQPISSIIASRSARSAARDGSRNASSHANQACCCSVAPSSVSSVPSPDSIDSGPIAASARNHRWKVVISGPRGWHSTAS